MRPNGITLWRQIERSLSADIVAGIENLNRPDCTRPVRFACTLRPSLHRRIYCETRRGSTSRFMPAMASSGLWRNRTTALR